MKKIAVVAANGKAAGKIIEEAVDCGFEVAGFGGHPNNTVAQHYVQKDVFDLSAGDLKGFDAVVDAVGAWTPDTWSVIPQTVAQLVKILAGSKARLVVVGGAGSLFVNKERTSRGAASTFSAAMNLSLTARGRASSPMRITRPLLSMRLKRGLTFGDLRFILGAAEFSTAPLRSCMQISTKFTIAVHILAAVEFFGGGEKVTSGLLASSIGANPVIVRNLMADLKKAGLLGVKLGTGGAYILKPLSEVTFYDVYAAVEKSKDNLFRFHGKPNPKCPVGRNIHAALDGRLSEVQREFEDDLKRRKVGDVVREIRRLAGNGLPE